MQISAHYRASIDIMDNILSGMPAEKAILQWSRSARYAGSKDREAVRNIIFDILRNRASFAHQTSLTGRGLAIAHAANHEQIANFDGGKFSPEPLTKNELAQIQNLSPINPQNIETRSDIPAPFAEILYEEYGEAYWPLSEKMRERAPLDIRVNRQKTDRDEVQKLLAKDYIFTEKLDIADALRVTQNPRKLAQSWCYAYGYVEPQDYSSQKIAQMAPITGDEKILDYCAGGGGKSLAMAARLSQTGQIDAWDISADRMKPLAERALRSDADIHILKSHPTEFYDIVFVDAPCSGSGAWRRTPDSKWRLTPNRLEELVNLQQEILSIAQKLVRPNGYLIYATCSLFSIENSQQTEKFLKNFSNFELLQEEKLSPLNAGDGFYGALFQKNADIS